MKVLQKTGRKASRIIRHGLWTIDQFIANMTRPLLAYLEERKYGSVKADCMQTFFVVSCGRNTGPAVINCLQSVYNQNIDRKRVKHLMVDDASDNGTDKIISEWLNTHTDNNVEFIRNLKRKGGTANTLEAFRKAPTDSVLLELNADDWLADDTILDFLSKVYSDPQVWMTYNSYEYSDNSPCERGRSYPDYVIRSGSYRDYEWICQHLHSFRSELLHHLPNEVFIDPETGDYFTCADDRSIYWSLLELCGSHSTHLYKTSYIYNFHENTDMNLDPTGSLKNVEKIKLMPRFDPLRSLHGPTAKNKL